MLGVDYIGYETSYEGSMMPFTVYKFSVFYCMRKYEVTKRYTDFLELHNALTQELLLLPSFPEKSMSHKMLVASPMERGTQLANYVQRVHSSLASKTLFSPRLMEFLEIDFRRVHSEEEGQLLLALDSPNLPPNSVWHMVEEGWLKKWRKFMMGRGPRRFQ